MLRVCLIIVLNLGVDWLVSVYFERRMVPVMWVCKITGKVNSASRYAVYDLNFGWICSCSQWVLGNDKDHVVLRLEKRCVAKHV